MSTNLRFPSVSASTSTRFALGTALPLFSLFLSHVPFPHFYFPFTIGFPLSPSSLSFIVDHQSKISQRVRDKICPRYLLSLPPLLLSPSPSPVPFPLLLFPFSICPFPFFALF